MLPVIRSYLEIICCCRSTTRAFAAAASATHASWSCAAIRVPLRIARLGDRLDELRRGSVEGQCRLVVVDRATSQPRPSRVSAQYHASDQENSRSDDHHPPQDEHR